MNLIPIETLKQQVGKAGLRCKGQAAFWKVGCGGYAMYISKADHVGRVDLNGFTIKHSAVSRLTAAEASKAKLGRVRGQLNFTKPEDRVLEAFSTALAEMKRLAAQDAKEDAKPARKPAKRTPKAIGTTAGGATVSVQPQA